MLREKLKVVCKDMGERVAGGHFWHDRRVATVITPAMTNDSTPALITARWHELQLPLSESIGEGQG